MIGQEIFTVEKFKVYMKQLGVDVEVLSVLEILHTYWTVLSEVMSIMLTYRFSLIKPFFNAEVMKSVNARQHAAKIAIMQFFLANGASKRIFNELRHYLLSWDHINIEKVDQVTFKLGESLFWHFEFYQ